MVGFPQTLYKTGHGFRLTSPPHALMVAHMKKNTAYRSATTPLAIAVRRRGLTAKHAAEVAGVSRWCWRRWELGHPASRHVVGRLIHAVRVLGLDLVVDHAGRAVLPRPL